MEANFQRALAVLKEGGVIAYPTDTVYGLGGDALNEETVKRVYQIKHRPLDQPLPLLFANKTDIINLADSLPEAGELLAQHFWPGGLTLVVRKSSLVPRWIGVAKDTVAIRIPDHPLTLALIQELGKPLVGTSANLSGFPSPISAGEVQQQLGGHIDFIFDGGICPGGIESTVVDVSSEVPKILREGAVSLERIRAVLGTASRR